MILSILTFLIISLAGTLLVRLSIDGQRRILFAWWASIPLGITLGHGCASLSLFLVAFVNDGLSVAGILMNALCWLLISGAVYAARPRQITPPQPAEAVPHPAKPTACTIAVCGLACIWIGLAVFSWNVMLATQQDYQHGNWDAWTIWNLRARFLARSQDDFTRAFEGGHLPAHADYPLMLPITVSQYWVLTGDESEKTSALIAKAATFLVIMVLTTVVTCLRNLRLGLLGGIILMSMPNYISSGAWQFADVPLSLCILSTFSMLLFANQTGKHHLPPLFHTGVLASCAAWTKNEGQLFALILTLVIALQCLSPYGIIKWGKRLAAYVCGLGLLAIPILIFKLGIVDTQNDIIAGQDHAHIFAMISEGNRYAAIWAAMQRELWTWVGWNLFAFPIAWLLLGTRKRAHLWRSGWPACSLVLLLLLLGYFLVYLVTPKDLAWHLSTSCNRVLSHLYPSAILLLAVSLPTGDEWKAKPTGLLKYFAGG